MFYTQSPCCQIWNGSHLLEGNSVNGLDNILPSCNFLEDIVGVDLIVLNNATNLEHVHAVGDWKDLDVLVPDESESQKLNTRRE